MSKITPEMIDNLSKLSAIECTNAEKENLAKDLENILNYMEQLNELKTVDILPCDQVIEISCPLREDVTQPTLPHEAFLANAPEQVGGMVKIPLVIK